MNLQEITKTIHVSEATIVRFVKKLGFKGFIDFKLEIAKQNYNPKPKDKNNYTEIIESNFIKSISSTKKLLNKLDIDKSINLITSSNNMYIFGLGSSGVAAVEMQTRFLRYGKLCFNISDSHFQTIYAATASSKDVAVIISLSGETKEAIHIAKQLKKSDCKIIVITNYILSPVAKFADIVLLTAAKEMPLEGGSLVSKIAQLYIIDILATGYAIKNSNKVIDINNKIVNAIFKKGE